MYTDHLTMDLYGPSRSTGGSDAAAVAWNASAAFCPHPSRPLPIPPRQSAPTFTHHAYRIGAVPLPPAHYPTSSCTSLTPLAGYRVAMVINWPCHAASLIMYIQWSQLPPQISCLFDFNPDEYSQKGGKKTRVFG